MNGRTNHYDLLKWALEIVPKIRSRLQLIAFLVAVIANALIYRVDPNNIQAMIVVSLFGLALVAIPLVVDEKILKHIPRSQRAPLILLAFILMFVSVGAAGYVTYSVASRLAPQGSRFDSRLEVDQTRWFKLKGGVNRVELTWQLFPLSDKPADSATVFIGMIVLHDESMISGQGLGKITTDSCDKVPSCVGSYIFRELSENPLHIRAGSPGTPFTTMINLKRVPKNLRIWWEFYQREGASEMEDCGPDYRKIGPSDGIPPLAMFNKDGKLVGGACYRSYGQKTVVVNFT